MSRHVPAEPNPAKPYSPCATSAAGLIFTAGQIGHAPDGSLPEGLQEQVHHAMTNLFAALEAAGATETDVLAVNVFLSREDDFDEMNDLYRPYFTKPYPARTTITTGLRPGVRFEVNAVAQA